MSDPSTLDPYAARAAIEYCYEQGWTDGLPVVPPTEDYVQQFIECAGRDPQEVLATMEHLDRPCTVEQAAISAVMAGCLPEYFPIVVGALEALWNEVSFFRGGCASTSGGCPLIVVNGPIRNQLGINCKGNVFGPGFRPNATIGRAIRLIVLNVFGMRPHELDQTTQGTPAKYTFCIGENEEESPWEPLHVEKGFPADSNTVTVYMARSNLHVENRHTDDPEQVLLTIADALSYAGGVLCRAGTRMAVVMGPEHAQLIARAGWSKAAVKQFLWEHHGRLLRELRPMGKGDTQEITSGRFDLVSESHGKRMPGAENETDDSFIHFSSSSDQILLVVAGASNAGVSTVVPSFGSIGYVTSSTRPIVTATTAWRRMCH